MTDSQIEWLLELMERMEERLQDRIIGCGSSEYTNERICELKRNLLDSAEMDCGD